MTEDAFDDAEKVAEIERPDPIIIRHADGAIFEPSDPGYLTWPGPAGSNFYFRRIERLPDGVRGILWWRRPVERWKRTGEVWQAQSGEFAIQKGGSHD